MHAVIQAGSRQYNVEVGKKIKIDKIKLNINDELIIDKVLLISSGDKVNIGTPFIKNAAVRATVLDHGKDKKVISFRYKKKKGYHRKVGHRQQYTEIEIKNIEG